MNLEQFINASISGELGLDEQKKFLLDLNESGFTGADIATMVNSFYKQMPQTLDLPGAIDLCGTGGSGLSRINTSTLSAIVLAACGVPVAKHGNKAASGRFGSFDLLEALGINIMADKGRLETLYKELDLAFIFARSFHPVFKHFAQVRQELKVKTIFNILGPLLNPANTQYQIIGTSNLKDMRLIADAAKALGKKHVLVLNGSDGLDELTLTGETAVLELRAGEIESSILKPEDFGFEVVDFSEIEGGDRDFNVNITDQILDGSCLTQHLNLVLANTALALKFMGKVDTYIEGVDLARTVINKGATRTLIHNYSRLSHTPDILLEITVHKRQEVETLKSLLPLNKLKGRLKKSDRDFKAAIAKRSTLNLIAEIKRSSPSDKEIFKGDFNAGKIASIYESSGADAISVLTDEKFFNGSLENLQLARTATKSIPLLMKDFIIDEYQIYLARHYGADAILLIVAVLSSEEIDRFTALARSLGLDVLLEVHNLQELEIAKASSADIIGINNRDLHTFSIDTKTFLKLFHHIPNSKIVVAESGYTAQNTHTVHGLANATLVGTSIMKSKSMIQEIRKIKTTKRKFKACGIRGIEAGIYCEKHHVDFVGLNFVPASKRKVDVELAKSICEVLIKTISVGIFQDETAEEVNRIAKEVGLDFVQLSGKESAAFCTEMKQPVIKTISVSNSASLSEYNDVVSMFIIDGVKPGSGESYDYSTLEQLRPEKPFLVAGGVNETNIKLILETLPVALGVDTATGIETDGQVDIEKIDKITKLVARF